MFTSRALAILRRNTERWLVDAIEIWRPSEHEELDDTLIGRQIKGEKVYEGKARLTPTRGPRELALPGEGVVVLRDTDVLIPYDGFAPWRDDEVYVTVSEDPEMQGRWLRITDVRIASQQAARRFSAVQAQPSKDWHRP
jgi:hypothetical protein